MPSTNNIHFSFEHVTLQQFSIEFDFKNNVNNKRIHKAKQGSASDTYCGNTLSCTPLTTYSNINYTLIDVTSMAPDD